MAYLISDDRRDVWAFFMSIMGPAEREGSMTKADFRAAIDAVDVFLADNITTINNVFPTAARTSLTAVEKIGVVAYVALKRFGKEVV